MWVGTATWYAFGEPQLPLVSSGVFWAVSLINLVIGNGVTPSYGRRHHTVCRRADPRGRWSRWQTSPPASQRERRGG
jgi:hypothetical protein